MARSFQGHAGAHGTIPALADCLHLAAAAAWLGGLLQLALLPSITPAIARRVRRLATTAVLVLLPAGVFGARVHVPHLHLLVDSPYGRVLLAKLAFAAVLLALGAASHFRHVPAVARSDAALRRTVGRELAIAAAVLGLTALLATLPMPPP